MPLPDLKYSEDVLLDDERLQERPLVPTTTHSGCLRRRSSSFDDSDGNVREAMAISLASDSELRDCMSHDSSGDASGSGDELLSDIYEVTFLPVHFKLCCSLERGHLIVTNSYDMEGIKKGDMILKIDNIPLDISGQAQENLRETFDFLEKKQTITIRFLRTVVNAQSVRRSVVAGPTGPTLFEVDFRVSKLEKLAEKFKGLGEQCFTKNALLPAMANARRALLIAETLGLDYDYGFVQQVGADSQPKPDGIRCKLDLSTHYEQVGKYLRRLGETGPATACFKSALGVLRNWSNSGELSGLVNQARVTEALCVQYRKGRHFDEAQTLCSDMLRRWERFEHTYAHHDMRGTAVDLGEQVGRGKANALHQLASILKFKMRKEEAEETAMKCLLLRRKILGSSHLDVSQSLNFLACLKLESLSKESGESKFLEIERMFCSSLDIVNKVCGHMSANAAAVLRNMAWLYHKQGQLPRAIEAKEKEVTIRRLVMNQFHNPFGEASTATVAWSSPHSPLRPRPVKQEHSPSSVALVSGSGGGGGHSPSGSPGAGIRADAADAARYKDDMHAYMLSLDQEFSRVRQRGTNEYHPELAAALCQLTRMYDKMNRTSVNK